MSTYVLVHGGGHGGWCWQKLAPLLRAAGHEVYTPTLTGLGERSHLLHPEIDLDTHIQDIVGVLKYEGITEAILVGHSYGGMVITGVADRALSRVGQLVYLDAARPYDGESLAMVSPGLMNLARKQARIVNGIELVLWPDSEAVPLYGVTDPHDFAWMKPKLTPHPWKCFEQPIMLANEPTVQRIARTSINCTATLQVRPEESRRRALDADRVWEVDTGHDLMITEPKAVAAMLLQIA